MRFKSGMLGCCVVVLALLGTILAFMMAVTTLSLPSIIMLRKVMKTPLLVIFTGTCVVGITIVGYLFNIFQQFFM